MFESTDLPSDRDELLAGLDPSQRAAVTSEAAPLAILAGAGSGKTRVLTRRIAYRIRSGTSEPEHVLAVTFTRKAAAELVDRLGRLGVHRRATAGTFHAIALAQLRRHAADRGRSPPTVLASKVPLLRRVLGDRLADQARDVASEIEWAKARQIPPDQYAQVAQAAGRDAPLGASRFSECYRQYEELKRSRGTADFDDLIRQCAEVLERDDDFARVQRWRFRHLFVDEFQDATPAQVRMVRAFLGERSDLCVVGDGDQAIYAFAGADPSYLTEFARHFPGGTVVHLEGNYRSTPQVVRASRAVLSARPRDAVVRTTKPDGPEPAVVAYDTDDGEAAGVVEALRATRAEGLAWSRAAVLVRVNAQSALFEQALRRAAIPHRVRGSERFVERAEVRAALDELRRTARESPGRPFADLLPDLLDPDDEEADGPTAREQREHAQMLVRLGQEYVALDGGRGTVEGFVDHLRAVMAGEGGDDRADAVEILTFHRAKGLEWDTVLVTGLERGLVPISHARAPDALAEEQRLLHVALSRAERRLHLSWSRERTFGTRVSKRAPSPLLAAIEAAFAGPTVDPAATRVRGVATARRTLEATRALSGAGPPPDPKLLSALKDWRRNRSRAAGVPAYVVFSDATLTEIATLLPTTLRELLIVNGVGPVKAERYGEEILEIVRGFASG